ncbi:MAG: S9 family peptidase [Herpetosiphon sp.]
MRYSADQRVTDMTPREMNVRTRVHEYGGAAFSVGDGVVYFSCYADQRLYRQAQSREVTPLTAEGRMRYADSSLDRCHGRIFAVREDHGVPDREAKNTIVAIDLARGDVGTVVVSGNDFYAAPRLSPDGSQIAWLTWNHPHMPWDGTELWLAEVGSDGLLRNARAIAGGPSESVQQPVWSPDGQLYFISDRSGWWNLYRWDGKQSEHLYEMASEFGQPQWVFGLSTYGFASPQLIICSYFEAGSDHLARLDLTTRTLEEIPTPYTVIRSLQVAKGHVLFIGASPLEAPAVVRMDVNRPYQTTVLHRSHAAFIDPAFLSVPRPIEFPTEKGVTAHGFFYAPKNAGFASPPGERPPLLVMSHGGPTSHSPAILRLSVQYWTSRGVGVLDVNYGGSTGYGRAYRQRLNGQWGIVDVDDCVNGARFLVAQGEADGSRLAITGGSAGGFTTLCALTFRDTFATGASHFGVADLEGLARDTHKFESRYLDSLVGAFPAQLALYRERSPLYHVDRLERPMILFQGLEDPVVPPAQAESMFAAVKAKGIPVAYVAFAGEQHGFRRSENIRRALEGEFYFYGRIFRFLPADEIEPVEIENLP